jgi:hypothetical protein
MREGKNERRKRAFPFFRPSVLLSFFLLTALGLFADDRSNMIRVADPRVATRLVKGFYSTDNAYWRWTAREFSIILNPPKGAAQRGAVLVLRYAIVEGVLANLKTMDLSIAVDGVTLPRQHCDKPGQFTLRLDVPPEALRFDPVRVDFTLDKALPPTGREVRELGIIVSEVGLESK